MPRSVPDGKGPRKSERRNVQNNATQTALPENNLDILRAFAVLSVLFAHFIDNLGGRTVFTTWVGHAGVLAFFVHTALVLMASLERDDAPERTGWIRRFYLRRACRIYPLAWAVILFVLVARIPSGSINAPLEPRSAYTVVANLLLMQNWAGAPNVIAPLWTLPLEVQMYLALPICFLLARKPYGQWRIAVAIVCSVALAYANLWGLRPENRIPGLWRVQIPEYIPCFLMGVLAYALLRARGLRGAQARVPAWTWTFIIIGNMLAVGAVWLQGREYYHVLRWGYCLLLGLLIPLVSDAGPSALTRVAHTLAKYSYGIYLLHPLAIRFGFGTFRDQPMIIRSLVSFAVLGVACFAAYHLVEKPGINFGQRLLGLRNRPAPLEATATAP
ncbi:MAG: acyltransferase [Phycisphaerae bacterium]|nr:acyltransferase [Gemmatimonadaceae bacterium]